MMNHIATIGTGFGGTEITKTEYDEIMAVIQSRPNGEGKGYRLRTDLTWEEYDLPPRLFLMQTNYPRTKQWQSCWGRTMTRGKVKQLRALIEQLSATLDDETALTGIELFPAWRIEDYEFGDRRRHNDKLYKCVSTRGAGQLDA